jgi:ABC-type phosphate transport system permease subunit
MNARGGGEMKNHDLIKYGIATVIAGVILYYFWAWILVLLILIGVGTVIHEYSKSKRLKHQHRRQCKSWRR